MDLTNRFCCEALMISVLVMSLSGCAAPGSVKMSRYNTSWDQTKSDWDDCVEQVRLSESDPYARLGKMMGEGMWGAPYTKECMRRKGYTEDR